MIEPWEQAAQLQQKVQGQVALEPWEQAAQIPGPDFAQRMSNDFQNRVINDQASLNRYEAGQQGVGSTTFQLLGQGAGLANDAVANVVGSGIRYMGDLTGLNSKDSQGNTPIQNTESTISKYIPEGVKDAASGVGNVINKGIDYLNQKFPVAMANTGAAANIVSVIPLGKAVGALGKVADKGYLAAKDAFEARRLNAIQQMIMPKQTAAEIADNAKAGKYTSEGLLNTRTYSPSQDEIAQAKVISALPVKPSNPYIDNIKVIKTAQEQKSLAIQKALEEAGGSISPSNMTKYNQAIADSIARNPMLNEHGATVKGLLDTAQMYVDANPKTAAGLWNARKQFDKHVLNFQPGSLEQGAASKAFSFTAKQIRNGFNQAIVDSAPNAKFGEFLKDYTYMANAIDDMSTNVAGQGANSIDRFLQTKKGKVIVKGAKAAGFGGAGIGGYLGIKNAISKSGESSDYSSKDGGD